MNWPPTGGGWSATDHTYPICFLMEVRLSVDHWVGSNVQLKCPPFVAAEILWGLEHNHGEQDMLAVLGTLVE